jgi:predicted permease
MRHNPGFTLLAIFVIALGIGANTAMFSVVNTVLLKPLAYRDPDRIVTLRNHWTKSSRVSYNVSGPDVQDWHDQSTVFEHVAFFWDSDTTVIANSNAEYAHVAAVSPEFFDVFGVRPVIGRGFSAEEQKSAAPVAVVSLGWARAHFGEPQTAIGKSIRVDDKTATIAGILPAGFDFPKQSNIWLPLNTTQAANASRSAHNYRAIGLLKSGVTLEQARAQMTAIGSRLEQIYPNSNTQKNVAVDRMRDAMVGNFRLTLYLLLAAVGVVLLIACANIANLLLAKATRRTREIAIRAAVGASRGRIVRQLMIESLALAIVAGSAGVILAIWGVEAIKALAPPSIPRLLETQLDVPVLLFALAISVLSALVFGLAPALAASRIDLNNSLKQGAAKSVIGGGAGRLRAVLVVAEIALSVVLLTGAGLLIRSFGALTNVDLGFRTENILIAEASVPAASNEDALKRAVPFDRDMLAAMAALPGVTGVGGTFGVPGNPGSDGGYWIDHMPPVDQLNVTAPQAVFEVITPGTLATLGIPLKAGRDFSDRDTYAAPFTAIVNEALVRQSFQGQNPIGRVLFCGFDSFKGMTIVGIAADTHQYGPDTPPKPEIFMPYEQHPRAATDFNLLARTVSEPAALAESVRRKMRERDPEVPVKFTTMQAAVAQNIATPRFRMVLLGLFAGLAVCLAMAGVYGVMSYIASQRANEIGLRMALGADSGDVLRLMLGQGLLLAGIGLVIGLAASVAATRSISSLLFAVKPADPLTYGAVIVILSLVTLLACYIPARRATQVDPLVALRQE